MYEMCMTRYWTYTAVPLGSSSSSSSSTCDHGHHGHKMAPWHPHELVGTGGEFTGHPGFSYIYIYIFILNLRVWGKFSLCPSLGIVGTNISTWHTWHSFSFAQFSTWGYVKPISSNTKIQCVYIIYIHRIHSLILDDLGYPYCWNIRIGVTQFSLPKPSIFWLLFKVPFFMVTSPDFFLCFCLLVTSPQVPQFSCSIRLRTYHPSSVISRLNPSFLPYHQFWSGGPASKCFNGLHLLFLT